MNINITYKHTEAQNSPKHSLIAALISKKEKAVHRALLRQS